MNIGAPKKTAYQAGAYLIQFNGNFSGTQEPAKSHTIFHPDLDYASRLFQQQDPSPGAPYVNLHNWYLTPSSFRLISLELRMFMLEGMSPADIGKLIKL